MNFLSYFRTVQEIGAFLISARAMWVYNLPAMECTITAREKFHWACQIVSLRAQPHWLALALACPCGKMSSALLTRWLFVSPATFAVSAVSLIHSGPGQSPAFMLQDSSCQQLCQKAPLKVRGRPDRLAPPSAVAFGKEMLLFLAPPLGCTRAYLPEGWADPSVRTGRPKILGPFIADARVPQPCPWIQHQNIPRRSTQMVANTDGVHHWYFQPGKSIESMPPLPHLQPQFSRLGKVKSRE